MGAEAGAGMEAGVGVGAGAGVYAMVGAVGAGVRRAERSGVGGGWGRPGRFAMRVGRPPVRVSHISGHSQSQAKPRTCKHRLTSLFTKPWQPYLLNAFFHCFFLAVNAPSTLMK